MLDNLKIYYMKIQSRNFPPKERDLNFYRWKDFIRILFLIASKKISLTSFSSYQRIGFSTAIELQLNWSS